MPIDKNKSFAPHYNGVAELDVPLASIKALVRETKKWARKGDDERAGSFEAIAHQTALDQIARGVHNPRELAQEALKTVKVKFGRYSA